MARRPVGASSPLVAVFVAFTLSGCFGGAEGPSLAESDDDGPGVADEPSVTTATGAVAGFVLDVAFTPLGGALVTVTESGANVTTDESGAYAFEGLEPGAYTLLANLTGYRPKAKPVTVAAGKILREQFLLEALPTGDPFVDEPEPFQGFLECSLGSLGRCSGTGNNGNHRPSGVYPLREGIRGLVVEMTWSPQQGIGLNDDGRIQATSSGGGGGMQLGVQWGGNNGGGSVAAEGVSGQPLRVVLVREVVEGEMRVVCREGCRASELGRPLRDFPDEAGPTVSYYGAPNFPNVVAQRPFTVYLAAFHFMEPPAGYTRVPEA